jgi:hypothetical protein
MSVKTEWEIMKERYKKLIKVGNLKNEQIDIYLLECW